MLDNFDISSAKKALEISRSRVEIEVSGNLTLDNVEAFSNIGVGYLSIGGLTKNIKAIDLSMKLFD